MIPLIVDCRIMLPGLNVKATSPEGRPGLLEYDPLADLEQAAAVYSVSRDKVLEMGRSTDDGEYPQEHNGVLAELIFAVEGVRELEHCIFGHEPWVADFMQEDWGFLDKATMRALYDDAAGMLPAAELKRNPEPVLPKKFTEEVLAQLETDDQWRGRLVELAAKCQDYSVALLTLWTVETSQGHEDLYADIDGFEYRGLARVVLAQDEPKKTNPTDSL
jgi:hypothetical protein